MAKRSRKQQKRSSTSIKATPSQPAASGSNGTTTSEVNFVHDYYYVYSDMRTMVIITVVMAAVAVGLSYLF